MKISPVVNNTKYGKTSFGSVRLSGELGVLLTTQALKNDALRAYSSKAEHLTTLCSSKAELHRMFGGGNKVNFFLSCPSITKDYEKHLGECERGQELNLFLNLDNDVFTKAERLLYEISDK